MYGLRGSVISGQIAQDLSQGFGEPGAQRKKGQLGRAIE